MTEFLIIKPSSLGDVIHGLQVVQTLREQLALRISWVIQHQLAPLLEACPTVDEVYPFYRDGGLSAFYRLIRSIRQKRYDAVLDLQGLARSGLLTFWAKSARKIGRRDAREGVRLCYNEQISLPQAGQKAHAIDILLQFCPCFGLAPQLKGKLCFQTQPSLDALTLTHLFAKQPILLFPNSRRPEKRWALFPALTDQLLRTFPHKTVVWAGQEVLPERIDWPRDRFYNLIGKTTLTDLPLLIKAASVVVSNDSGPMHLTAALQKPLIALFGPTDPNQYGPYPLSQLQHQVLKARLGKMEYLEVKEILEALAVLLKEN